MDRDQLFEALEQAPAFVFVFDADLRYRYLNQVARDRGYGGRSMDELRGLNGVEAGLPPEQVAKLAEHDRRVLESGRPCQEVEHLLGETMLSIKWPVYRDGRVDGVAGIGLDITEMHRRSQHEVDWLAQQVNASTDIVEALAEGLSKLAMIEAGETWD